MSDEVTIRASLQFEKLRSVAELLFGPLDFDVSGRNFTHKRQNVGTAEEPLALDDVAPGGFVIGVNRDATNYVEIRPGSGLADLIKVGPGEPFLFRTAADSTPYVIANTAECELEFLAVDA